MRIAYIINGLNGGGAAFPMAEVIGLMHELGHEVRVWALLAQDGKAGRRLEAAQIPYEIVGHRPSSVILPAVRLARELTRFRADLIWTSLTRGTIYGQLIGGALRIPVVSWQHSAYLKPANITWLRRLRRLTSHWVADSVAVGEFAQQALGLSSDQITVWTPFLATPNAPHCAHRIGSEPIRLGTLGRLHVSKQYHILIEAFARAQQIAPALTERLELHIAGDGPEEASLKALVKRLDLDQHVHFAGFAENPRMFLATLHGYAQTSMKEGFCIAAHEAMQAGLPVIATRVGELKHSIRPGQTGWLCEVGDIEDLALAIVEFASDPARSAQRGAAAREWVLTRYSVENFRGAGTRLLDLVHERLFCQNRRQPAVHS